MRTRNFGKKSLIGLSLLTAVLCAGCGVQAKEDNRANEDNRVNPGDTPYAVMYYHDDFHRVSCWVTSFAMHCLPDSSVANGGA